MELKELGYNDWFHKSRLQYHQSGFEVARVTRVDRERFLVRNETSEVQAEPTGKLLYFAESAEDVPCVGDWVLVQYYNGGELAIIHEVLPRKSFLHRKSAGKKIDYQLIAANIDVAFIIQSCDFDFNLRRMERYLVMAKEGNIEPVILLSKSDLVSGEDLTKRISEIRQARIETNAIPFSNETGKGLEIVRQQLEKGKTYCLLGSSGVGKTTLLNHLIGKDIFDTNPVREKDGRGRHTTARRQLTILGNGALLIDTPGMRELGMLAVGISIEDRFSDIHELTTECRFNDCTHTNETGCAVLSAIENGQLSEDRFRGYKKLIRESEYHEMSYVERRRKDKKFGRMVKSVMKYKKKE
jgi:ribosome biogenesis GTPase